MASEKEELYERLVCLTESLGGKVNRSSDYPAWEYVEETAQYYLHLFAKEQPDLNWENPKSGKKYRRFFAFGWKKGLTDFGWM